LQDPSAGALGALPEAVVREIVEAVADRLPVSATVGDLPPQPRVLVDAAERMAATGVEIVKVGFFGDEDARPAISALGKAKLGRARLVAVLMADRPGLRSHSASRCERFCRRDARHREQGGRAFDDCVARQ
jgi:hypothetical protein